MFTKLIFSPNIIMQNYWDFKKYADNGIQGGRIFQSKTGTPYGTQQKKESASSSLSPKWGAIYILCHIYLTHLPALFLPFIKYKK